MQPMSRHFKKTRPADLFTNIARIANAVQVTTPLCQILIAVSVVIVVIVVSVY